MGWQLRLAGAALPVQCPALPTCSSSARAGSAEWPFLCPPRSCSLGWEAGWRRGAGHRVSQKHLRKESHPGRAGGTKGLTVISKNRSLDPNTSERL